MVHPDVRRMLLEAKAFVEGGQAFILWTALQADLQTVRRRGRTPEGQATTWVC